ncbi:MAG: indole-3-glycerol-phosphate synthase [Planctomycetes bacterium]|nr:indole-3-glycerol-phosphate synthase [Planctomycetota bacterium]
MSDFLEQMAASSLKRAQQMEGVIPANMLMTMLSNVSEPKPLLNRSGRIGVIAEYKRHSPSAGELADVEVDDQVIAYSNAGASVISVLTEPERFHGNLDDLRLASASTSIPIMRKDFLVTPYQIIEARFSEASGVLLIAAILPGDRLKEMIELAQSLNMFALVEAFDEPDIEHSLNSGAELVGVNCRNLRTLEVDSSRFEKLASLLKGVTSVAESGITNATELTEVESLGYDYALIGSALMKHTDPQAVLQAMMQRGVDNA